MRVFPDVQRIQLWTKWTKSQPLPQVFSGDTQEQPLRAELFSRDQHQRHARSQASAHRRTTQKTRDRLILRLNENEKGLLGAYGIVTAAVARKPRTPPASDW